MSLFLSWSDLLLRLLLTLAASGALGVNRGAHSQAAGLRTTILVALAACVAMIETNQLLSISGKEASSFVTVDPMRLPLGVLTGVGFIGGGAILKKGETVRGLTTAATLWVTTVIGLCFGGGALLLGGIATCFALATILAMEWIDVRIPRHHQGTIVTPQKAEVVSANLTHALGPKGFRARLRSEKSGPNEAESVFEITWAEPELHDPAARCLAAVRGVCEIRSFELTTRSEH